MSIKQKFKNMWNKLRRKTDTADDIVRDKTDSELSAEEVVEEEIFPAGKMTVKRRAEIAADTAVTNKNSGCCGKAQTGNTKKTDKVCAKANVVPAHVKRTRPTNPSYQMIDPDDDTIDAGKS